MLFHKPVNKLLLVAFLAASCAPAATLQQLSMEQMTQSATAIVRARITGSTASLTGSTIYTHYKLQIMETWKGFPSTEVMLPGGVANGYRQTFPGVPELQPGTEYVLFLWTSSTGITHLVGMTQGLFSVTLQTDGSTQVSRPQIGETILDATGRQVRDQAVRMQLSEMKTSIGRTMAATSK
jgi:opacity protein-like surface antigen